MPAEWALSFRLWIGLRCIWLFLQTSGMDLCWYNTSPDLGVCVPLTLGNTLGLDMVPMRVYVLPVICGALLCFPSRSGSDSD